MKTSGYNAASFSFPKETPLPPISRGGTPHEQYAAGSDMPADDFSYSSKLSNVEAQRIMSVLQEIERKLMIIGSLPDHMDRRVATVFGPDTVLVITEHRLLEQKLKAVSDSREAARDPGIVQSLTNEYRELSKQLQSSTKSVCRMFLQNATALTKLRYLKATRQSSVVYFETLMQEIQQLVYERLKTSVEEENAKQDQLAIIIAKEKKTSNDVQLLREEIERAKKERSNEINKKNETIRRLKEELRQIKQVAEETTKKLESRSKQKEDADVQQFKDKESVLMTDINSLRKQLEETTKKNREEEANLRRKKFKVESEVENWIHKYDQDMEEKQAELEDIQAIFTEEKSQLDELQARYTALQKEYECIQEEKRIKEEKKKDEEMKLAIRIKAAIKIQAMWRGWKTRKELKKKDVKGKDKKGKKGKK